MITYINTKNREQYQNLFNKAEEVLKKAANAGILDLGIDDVNNLEISTLNQYFAYLQDLITASNAEEEAVTSENLKAQFLRLPLDEELFEIDANTRTISIPKNFSSNGIGVQGDETAEILYFSIDRYFDHMDLASEDMKIVIQWETKDKDKQIITGVSPNFGKDIETIPGKIIFGWPIYSELTESATPIKFAVRFFSVNTSTKILNYSLATLPSEISVGATIDYDIANDAVQEIDRNDVIIGRIKNVGIYEPSIPTPALPTVSTPLFVEGEENNTKIIDLPTSGDDSIILKISARPTDFGTVVYSWKKFDYDPSTGEYSQTPNSVFDGEVNNGVYEEVTEINDDLYYKISSAEGVMPVTYSPVVIDNILQKNDQNKYIYNEDLGFMQKDGSYIKLFKKYSTAKVNSVGVYTVNVGVRNGVNTVATEMPIEEGIKIPGPLKPVIDTPEEATEDGVVHLIADNGTAILKANAHKREEDENAVVSISYDWKKIINGTEESIDGDSVENSSIEIFALNQDNHGHVPADINEEDCIYNQAQVMVVQKGTNVIVYQTGNELRSYSSTNPNQGEGKWLGFDINTNEDSIEGLIWGNGYELNADDVAEAESVGLAAGHIIFWAKAEDLANNGGRQISINGTELNIVYIAELPSNEEYTFNTEKNEVIITGLSSGELDEQYIANVTAERNKVKTNSKSGIYRITNAPEKPVLKRIINNRQTPSDYQDEYNLVTFNMKRNGVYRTLSFSVEPPAQSDNLSYVWMRLNAEDNIAADWENNSEKLQIDLDDFLSDLFEDKPGNADIPVDGVYGLTQLTNLGEVVDTEDNGPHLEFNNNTPAGIYYCIVVNELNNHRVANVTPFYSVTNN